MGDRGIIGIAISISLGLDANARVIDMNRGFIGATRASGSIPEPEAARLKEDRSITWHMHLVVVEDEPEREELVDL